MVAKDRELFLGMKNDDTFGPLIIVGAGGILAEYFRDRAILLPDATEEEIADKIRRNTAAVLERSAAAGVAPRLAAVSMARERVEEAMALRRR